jgi:hypothetical protein
MKLKIGNAPDQVIRGFQGSGGIRGGKNHRELVAALPSHQIG